MNNTYPFVNGPLPYEYDSLEPFIDEKTMHLHHDRHLQTYIDNLNKLIEQNPALKNLSLKTLLHVWPQLPARLRIPVRNNAGGVYNHRFFFECMAPPCGDTPECALSHVIEKQFSCFDKFKEQFKSAALSVFGSGYAWLVSDRGRLRITTTANQDTPLIKGLSPIINIDVWEHAYYLKHYNERAAYIEDWFNVIDWPRANERFLDIMRGA